ncbi:MAG TPA: Crp/Fnr family transcriptional regulator [Holophaga sp.]|nr:Crp/Fnr family transcriptional regulator [Holophaga sp.]HPS68700.1 Crp/Fnr family transcriptional regulator [Holophaga sp.]
MQYLFPIFENLCPSWGGIAHLGVRRRIPKGTVILGLDAEIDGVYYIEEGTVETVLDTHTGPERVLYRVGRGCVFGEVCCFAPGLTKEVVVKARTDCTLHFFDRELIEGTIAREHPALLIELIRILGHIVRMYGVLIQDSLNLDFFTRVCRFLVYLVRMKGAEPGSRQVQVIVESGVTQADMARLLGVHRVTVTKAVKHLKDQGVLQHFTKRELRIADFQALCRLGEGGGPRP